MSAGHEFLKKLEAVEAEIRASSDKIAALQGTLPDENREEFSSRIDMATGSATLILSGKCKQFRNLCLKNIHETTGSSKESVDGKEDETAGFPTTREDLEGFWDMISLPIQKVRDGFTSIERLKENGWKENDNMEELKSARTDKTMSTNTTKTQGLRKKPLASKNDNNIPSPGDLQRREKLARQKEEARQRLLEFKKAARDKMLQQNNGDAEAVGAE
ncbi:disks large-associated protein 1-like [Tropilaelaps mercedesae]|uniref:Disks large-associated protein 1-like n=1 Tax=Tropilaelaps mercedesae TaxID=418985 RepID=A0A1V9X3F2_9ACAR|nr:disks large-associated protein 1-like [Tropilaelaps mercedesae]